eukprot:s7192_g3.t1
MTGIPGVPDSVFQAALGGSHRPVVPHRQRLLVAANKQVEVPKEAAEASNSKKQADSKKAKQAAAAKPKAGAKAKAGPKAKAKVTNPDENSKPRRAPYADTEYNIRRKAYFATFLI